MALQGEEQSHLQRRFCGDCHEATMVANKGVSTSGVDNGEVVFPPGVDETNYAMMV